MKKIIALLISLTVGLPLSASLSGTYAIFNKSSDKCLQVRGYSNSNGAYVEQYSYVGDDNQKWIVTPIGGGQYTIQAKHSNKVLDVQGASLANGALIQQYDYLGSNNQKWIITSVEGGYYTIQNVNSGKVLSVPGASSNNGVTIEQNTYSGEDHRKWKLVTSERLSGIQTISNGVLTVKVDLDRGGAISWISAAGSTLNVVDTYDDGRYVQQAYYEGDSIYRVNQHPTWGNWPWNPVQAGNTYDQHSPVISCSNSGGVITTVAKAVLWNVPYEEGECLIEQQVTIEGTMVKIHGKITTFVDLYPDDFSSSAHECHEIPAVYLNPMFTKVITYLGDSPWTWDSNLWEYTSITGQNWLIMQDGHPESRFPTQYQVNGRTPREDWVAYVTNNNWGVLVYNRYAERFAAGRVDGAAACSYLAAGDIAGLSMNGSYEFTSYLVIGNFSDLRTGAYQLHSLGK